MPEVIELGELSAEVVRKPIKHVHLSVYPPAGRVRISAPEHMDLDTIRVFTISRLGWIRSQQRKMQMQARELPREYLQRESHFVWGKRYLLQLLEKDAPPLVMLKHRHLVLQLRPGAEVGQRAELLESWYREQLKAAVPALIAKWEPLLGVQVARFFVQRMKTRWGSCNPLRQTIRLNTDLAKKPPEALEYVVVHEMTHLLEPTHNARFTGLLDIHLPGWRHLRNELNILPVRHEEWAG